MTEMGPLVSEKKLIQEFSIDVAPSDPDLKKAYCVAAWAINLHYFSPESDVAIKCKGDNFRFGFEGRTIKATIDEILSSWSLRSAETGFLTGSQTMESESKPVFISEIRFIGNECAECGAVGDEDVEIVATFDLSKQNLARVTVIWAKKLAPEIFIWMPERLGKLVDQLSCSAEESMLHSLDMLAETEEAAIAGFGLAADTQDSVRKSSLHHLFEKQVLETPGKFAVHFEDSKPVTYEDLNRRSNKLARYILQVVEAQKKKDFVAICLEKGISFLVSLLAVLKAGKTCVILDPEHPRHRIDQILNETGAPFIIACEGMAHLLRGAPTIDPINIQSKLETMAETNLTGVMVDSSSLSHVLFTSGSTGVPKGVMITHGAMVNNVLWLAQHCGLHSETRTLQFAAPTFDVCSLDIFMTLATGGCLMMARKTILLTDLNDFINTKKVNYAQLTPTVIKMLEPSAVPSLQTIASSGEPLTADIVSMWVGRVKLVNAYGPTETIVCTVHDVTGGSTPNCIGKPGCGLRTEILDERGSRVPIGVVGELCIAGPQLLRGYLNDASLTEKKTYTHLGDRLYRTGDQAKYDASGNIHCIGRQDQQVKLRGGIRMDLGEVEACIALTCLIERCAAFIPRKGPCKDRLAAVICLKASYKPNREKIYKDREIRAHGKQSVIMNGTGNGIVDGITDVCKTNSFLSMCPDQALPTLTKVKEHLLERLPAYMVPSTWFVLKEIPLTTSGKVSRLPLADWVETMSEEAYKHFVRLWNPSKVATNGSSSEIPRDASMQQLRLIWSEILSLPEDLISFDDSFFDLGGDSVSAIRMVSRARKAGLPISVHDVFLLRTLQHLHSILGRQIWSSQDTIDNLDIKPFQLLSEEASKNAVLQSVSRECHVNPDTLKDILPCSPLQEGLMALSARTPGAYVSKMVFRLSADVDPHRFRTTWEEVYKVESILRTRIVNIDSYGTLQAVVEETAEWTVVNSLDAELKLIETGEMSFGSTLCRFGMIGEDSQWYFLLWLHHAIFDKWSLELLMEKVRLAYRSGDTPSAGPPFSLFIQFLANTQLEAAEMFWSRQCDGVDVTHFPEVPSSKPVIMATRSKKISVEVAFQPLLNSIQITASTAIQAAWAIVQGRHSDSGDVSFGVTLSGRNLSLAAEDIVGPMLVTVPFITRIERSTRVMELLKGIQLQMIEMIPFEHIGLQKIQRLSSFAKDVCSFQTLLVVQPEDGPPRDDILSPIASAQTMQRTYALTIECELRKGEVIVNAHFDDNILSEDDVHWLLVHFETVLQQLVVVESVTTIGDVQMCGSKDLQQIESWQGVLPELENRCVHHLFEEQTKHFAHAPAIYNQASDEYVSYRELDTLSTRLSYRLKQHGVGPEILVPICFEKSPFAIISMLAILKAGGAYVPLDPSHPKSRLLSIIKDIGAKVALCSPLNSILFRHSVEQVIEVDLLSIARCTPMAEGRNSRDAQASNVAFATFTSGSTGKPKGVLLTHSAISTSIRHLARRFAMKPKMRVLQFTNYVFDMSLKDIFITLCCGGTVCIPNEYDRLNNLSRTAQEMKIDVAFLTPTVASFMQPQEVQTLKTLVVGGEALTRNILNRWANQVSLINTYGPTETVMSVTATSVTTASDTSNIGWGVTGQVSIVDLHDSRSRAPIGCVGEIAISGHTVASGYLNDRKMTRAAFVEDLPSLIGSVVPAPKVTVNCYLTGDIGRYNSDGSLQFLGRKDSQIKINGLRVEVAEVEYQLEAQNNEISQVAVDLVRFHGEQKPVLAAFVTIGNDTSGSPHVISLALGKYDEILEKSRCHLQNALPSYMIPNLFVPVSRLPMTVSGKIDRRALRNLAATLGAGQLEHLRRSNHTNLSYSPRSHLELVLSNLWKEVLELGEQPPITVSDDFFRLGGDSIAAIRLVSAARKEGISLSVGDIHHASRLDKMAGSCRAYANVIENPITPFSLVKGLEIGEIAALCGLSFDKIEDAYPTSPLQEGLIAISTRIPGTYVAQRVFKLLNCVETRFRRAWESLVQFNPVLRTRIVHSDMFGSLQIVCKENPSSEWFLGTDLKGYLDRDKDRRIVVGDRLCRFALIRQKDTGQPDYFVLTMSHCLYDGWSIQLIQDDIHRAYQQSSQPQFLPRTEYNRYIDFLARSNKTKNEDYWRRSMDGATPANFPPMTSATNDPLATCSEKIDTFVQYDALQDTKATVATVVRASWAYLLSRYMNIRDICFGMTLSGRSGDLPGLDGILGPTATTVPVRVLVEDKGSVREYLEKVQRESVEMLPFEQTGLQNIRQLGKEIRKACNFRNLLVIQQGKKPPKYFGNEDFRMVPVDSTADTFLINYALVMEYHSEVTGFSLCASYDPTCIDQKQIRRLLHQFVSVIRQMVAFSSDSGVMENMIMATEEDFSEIQTWNSHLPPRIERCVHDIFEERVAAHPERLAIDATTGGKLTYGQLNQYADRLGQLLCAKGIKVGDYVPILVRKSGAMVAAMLGVIKAGGSYVPIDPSVPAQRLKYLLHQVSARFIIRDQSEAFLEALEGLIENIIPIDMDTVSSLRCQNGYDRFPPGMPSAIAYCIFTSGSTGQPKGTLVSHAALCTALMQQAPVAGLVEKARVLQFSSSAFDVSCLEIFGTLINGGCVCIPSEEERMGSLNDFVNRMAVEVVCLTPSVLNTLLPEEIKTVKTLNIAGEPYTQALVDKWGRRFRLVNCYGPTECCILCAMNPDASTSTPNNIGRAIGGLLWVTEPDNINKLAAIGTVGELLVSGHNLALGYLNQAEKTEAAFMSGPSWMCSPFHQGSSTVYRTGDLVRYCSDGTIQYLGRRDTTQIKLHGIRVECGEIESAITSTGSITDAVVELMTLNGSLTLVAFISIADSRPSGNKTILRPSDGTESITQVLVSRVKKLLPSYMLPGIFVPFTQLPTNSSGKVDRVALRDISEDQMTCYVYRPSMAKRIPQTERQRTLQKIWASVLKVEPSTIGVDDNFFQLGGDSIRAMSLISAARRLGYALPFAEIYSRPELKQMAPLLVALESQERPVIEPFSLIDGINKDDCKKMVATLCSVTVDSVEDVFPCSPLQEGLMALSIKIPGAYATQRVYELPGDVDSLRVRDAWKATVAANPILRTRITSTETHGNLQVIVNDDFPWPEETIELDYWLSQNCWSPRYGSRLCKWHLIRQQGRVFFVIRMHHAIFDGFSLELLIQDFKNAYSSRARPKTQRTPFTFFVKYTKDAQLCHKAGEFWKTNLAGASQTRFPHTIQKEGHEGYKSTRAQTLDVNTKSAQNLGTITITTLLHAAYGLLVMRYTDSEDVCFGMTLSGRNASVIGIDTMTGPCIATVPIRIQSRKDMLISEYINAIHAARLAMLPYEHTGLQNIRRLSNDAKQACNLTSLLVIQPWKEEYTSEKHDEGFQMEIVECGSNMIDTYCLSIECRPVCNRIILSAHFDDSAISSDEVYWILYHFSQAIRHLMDGMKETPPARLGDISILGEEDIRQIQGWNESVPKRIDRCVHHIFEDRARQHPDRIAIQAQDGVLTYKELDMLSSSLAARLTTYGVGSDSLVPICFEKSSAMIVSMLAVMKAGGGYVPLDIKHPKQRLRFMVHQINANVLLCSKFQEPLCLELKAPAVFCPDFSGLYSDPATCARIEVKPSNIAYLLFTSGSTGQPKGVVIEHAAVTTSLVEQGNKFGFHDNMRVLQFCAYTFDVSVMEIFTTLLFGGCLCIPSEEDRLASLPQVIDNMRIQTAMLTSSTVSSMLSPELVPNLQTIILVGEPVTQQIIKNWSTRLRLINDYGPTETVVDSAANIHIGPDTSPSNLGKAMAANLWIACPDNTRDLTPIGCAGELLISGPTLARGYLDDEVKTKAVFIEGGQFSWTPSPQLRLYKTGDLARYGPDGSIFFIGRKDTQVQLRGQRVEVGEIEHNISICAGISNAAVELATLDAGVQTLVAFFCLEEKAAATEISGLVLPADKSTKSIITRIYTQLSDVMPSYFMPSLFLPLSNIPLTVSGKTNRKQLHSILSGLSATELSQYRSGDRLKRLPSTELERNLQSLWARVLNLEASAIGMDDNFFQLGGDSLAAIKLVSMAKSEKLSFAVSDVFRHPRLDQLLEVTATSQLSPMYSFAIAENDARQSEIYLRNREWAAKACETSVTSIQDIYRCSPLQQGLMALSARFTTAYVARRTYKLSPSIEIECFRSAWERTADWNPILRTRILQKEDNDEGSLQVICDEPLQWVMGSSIDEYLERDAQNPAEYGQPLTRCGLILSGDSLNNKTSSERYFVITLHHAQYDAYSYDLILNDFVQAYTGKKTLIPRKVPFKNYIRYLDSLNKEASQEFWRAELSGSAATTFPSLPSPGYTPKATFLCQLNIKVEHGTNFNNISLPSVLRAAWALTISRHTMVASSDAHEVCFGAILSGRTAPVHGMEEIVGPTIVTVPVRVKIDYAEATARYLERVHEGSLKTMGALEHFGLQNIMKLSADAEKACSFMNLLVIQASAQTKARSDDLIDMEKLERKDEMLHLYGIVMECQIVAGGVSCSAAFDPLMISEQHMKWVLRHFVQAVHELSNKYLGSRPLSQTVSFLTTQADLYEVLAWNKCPVPQNDRCLHGLVEEAASLYADREALYDSTGHLTYRQLNNHAAQLAEYLHQSGIGPGHLVPICFEKSSLMIIAMLGILKAGGAFVPLDPSHPPSRLNYILSQTEARIVLLSPEQRHLMHDLNDTGAMVVDWKFFKFPLRQETGFLDESHNIPCLTPDANNAAYVIYTSGSTGNPKGVVIEHRAISRSVQEHGKVFGHSRSVRALQFCNYTFDVSVIDVFATLIFGGCVCVPSEFDRLNNLAQVINEMRIDLVILTPTVAKLLDPQEVPRLKILVMTGEELTSALIEKWTQVGLGVEVVINGYGPTEAAVDCTATIVTKQSRPNNIGRSMGGLAWITEVDDHNKLAPLGCAGELVVSGSILGRGYLKDPERTNAAFVSRPVWMPDSYNHNRLYKTGDFARYAPEADGSIEYLGRKDTQIKYHGLRIDTGEIESQLEGCRNITQAAVDLISLNGIDTLVAFLCEKVTEVGQKQDDLNYLLQPDGNVKPWIDNAEMTLRSCMPSYMIPGLFIPLSSIPLTSSRKADRRKLKETVQQLPENQLYNYQRRSQLSPSSPETEMQRLLQKIWSDILCVDPSNVGSKDNFFLIGGDSISAIQLASAVRKHGFSLTVLEIYQARTLFAMAAVLDKNKHVSQGTEEELVPFDMITDFNFGSMPDILNATADQCCVQARFIQDIYPTTPIQDGLFALSMRDSRAYVNQRIFLLPSTIDINRFRMAWNKVCEHNEILRTRIVQLEDGKNYQAILEPHSLWDEAVDIEGCLNLHTNAMSKFGASLCRYSLVHEAEGTETYFIWTIHHALYDGWSMPMILDDLRSAYANPASIPRHTPFKGFVRHLLHLQSDIEAAGRFWKGKLANAVASTFPERPCSHKVNASCSRKFHFSMEQANTQAEITFATILKAAWVLVVARYSSSNDVCFGMALSGRNAPVPGIENMTGPTMVAVPIRVTINPEVLVTDFLNKLHSEAIEMLPYEHFGLQHIQKLAPSPKCCDFSSYLIIQPNEEASESTVDRLKLEEREGILSKGHYALTMECKPHSDKTMELTATFDPDVMDEVRIDWVLRQFSTVIQELGGLGHRNRSIGNVFKAWEFDLATIHTWNKSCPERIDRCVHDLFEEQVRRHPQLSAIEAFDGRETYSELDRQASGLAFDIMNLGIVGRESMVPICIENSRVMVIALLAILKAGAGYVPIDPDWPASRVDFILRDVNASLLLLSPRTASPFEQLANVSMFIVDEMLLEKYRNQRLDVPIRTACVPSNIVYVYYTSGSTGTPKGVVVEHSALCTTLVAQAKAYDFHEETRVLLFSSLVFDASVMQIFATLTHGACLCIPSGKQKMNNLTRAMREMQVEMAFLTPSVATLVDLAQVSSLKVLGLGGECMTQANIDSALEVGIRLINEYGPTEATIDAVANTQITKATSPNNIGYPLSGLAWVIDLADDSCLAPLGCVGELAISGHKLARGYLNAPERTMSAFIENTSWIRNGPSRIYKTGDLARYNSNGTLQYLGRRDTQVKIAGQRVELGEIEHNLCLLEPGLQIVVELLPESRGGRAVLTAFMVIKGHEISSDRYQIMPQFEVFKESVRDFRERLKDLIPSHMIPGLFIPISRIPLLESGKLDRGKLRHMYSSLSDEALSDYRLSSKRDNTRPTSKESIRMLNIWAEVLGFDPSAISLEDNFFDLGGDSISAMRLVAAARKEGLCLEVANVFSAPTLGNMCALPLAVYPRMGTIQLEDPRPYALLQVSGAREYLLERICMNMKIDKACIEDVLPATSTQLACLVEGQKWHEAYYAWFVVSIEGRLDVGRIESACQSLVNHTSIFRTAFYMEDRRCYQVVLRHFKIDVKMSQLASGEDETMFTLVQEASHGAVAFDRPMVKFKLLRQDSKTHYLLIGMSHSQYDGLCVPLIFRDLRAAYSGEAPCRPSYSRFIRHVILSNNKRAEKFWRSLLLGSTMTSLVHHSKTSDRSLLNSRIESRIPSTRARPHGMTFYTILKAAWALVLSEASESTDVVFGTLLSGRNAPLEGIEEMIGVCLNVVPMRASLRPEWKVLDLLQNLRQQQSEMIPFESVPFNDIIKYVHWPSSTRFGSVVQHQNLDMPLTDDDSSVDGLTWKSVGAIAFPGLDDSVDCWICTIPRDREIIVGMRFNDTTLRPEIARKLLNRLTSMLLRLSDVPDLPLKSIMDSTQPYLPIAPQSSNGTIVESGSALANGCASLNRSSTNGSTLTAGSEPTNHPPPLSCLRTLWQDILSEPVTDDNGIDESFFDLGGDSIAAAQLAVSCAQQRIALTLQDIFDYPTLRLQSEIASGVRARLHRPERDNNRVQIWRG